MQPIKTDTETFSAILENYKRLIFKVAGAYCRDPESRKDLVREISLQIWKSLPKYDEKFVMSTFIYRIDLNVAIPLFWLAFAIVVVKAVTGPGTTCTCRESGLFCQRPAVP